MRRTRISWLRPRRGPSRSASASPPAFTTRRWRGSHRRRLNPAAIDVIRAFAWRSWHPRDCAGGQGDLQRQIRPGEVLSASSIVGIDIGGTFTDLVLAIRRERSSPRSAPPRPPAPDEGASRASARSCASPAAMSQPWTRSCTVPPSPSTPLFEQRGAKTALLTDRGFRDVYDIGRGNRPDASTCSWTPAPAGAARAHLEVGERMIADGEVLTPLDPDAVAWRRTAPAPGRRGGRGVLSSFLCQPRARSRGRRGAAARRYPALSSRATRSWRSPRIRAHLDHRAQRLRRPALTRYLGRFGGDSREERACRQDRDHALERRRVRSHGVARAGSDDELLGPGGAQSAPATGRPRHRTSIAFDMGGTTAKPALIHRGEPPRPRSTSRSPIGEPLHRPARASAGIETSRSARAGGIAAGRPGRRPAPSARDAPAPIPARPATTRAARRPRHRRRPPVLRLPQRRASPAAACRSTRAPAEAAIERIGQLGLGVIETALGIATIADGETWRPRCASSDGRARHRSARDRADRVRRRRPGACLRDRPYPALRAWSTRSPPA